MGRSKNKSNLKILASYLILGGLACLAGFFIYSEVKIYMSTDNADENDTKLLKTGSLLSQIYEAESLSKLALQTKTRKNLKAYESKIDSILVELDSLKKLSEEDYQKELLDSLNYFLQKKVANRNELIKLKVSSDANSSFDSALEKFNNIEASLGIITPEMLAPNINSLSPEAQRAIKKTAAFLNENIPEDGDDLNNRKKVDSILNVSRRILQEAKTKDFIAQSNLRQKEIQVIRNDLELSQQMRSIISAFEREIVVNSYNENIKKQSALRRSIRLAGFAALMGFIITAVFTFLINRDFWRVQNYRERLEKEKKYSESLLKSREQLISTVSHDLRTPLNTITGYTELIENSGLTEKQSFYLKNVKSASGYVNNLVNDLLDYSKLEAGRLKIEKIPFVLSSLIKETAQSISEIYVNKPITLQMDIDENLNAVLLGDPLRIRQIITNLIGNAYKFTEKGFVKIQAKAIKQGAGLYDVSIIISDSGIGIKKEKQTHIFQEFTQADDTTEKKYGGYGLGLTITKKLVELLNGSLTLKSTENQGSTFTITLPLKISKELVISPEQNMESLTAQLSILIIDDDTAMLQLLEEVCQNNGIKPITYSDFSQIKKNVDLQYDLVLTDIQMPTIDGFHVLKKLKNDNYGHYSEQPIIAMTGRRDLETSAYQKAGFDKTIQKPFSKTHFFEVLRELFPGKFQSKTEQNQQKSVEKKSNFFDLTIISSFLGENEEAIDEVLYTFLSDTASNMENLKENVEQDNIEGIKRVSHKMLPMFRQLKTVEIIPILEEFEQLSEFESETKSKFIILKKKVTVLELALKKYLSSTSPSYNG